MLAEWHIGVEPARSVLWDCLLVQGGTLWEMTAGRDACFVHAPTHCGAGLSPGTAPRTYGNKSLDVDHPPMSSILSFLF